MKNINIKFWLLNNYRCFFLITYLFLFCPASIYANKDAKLVSEFINENKEVKEPAVINKNYLKKVKKVKTQDGQILQVVNKVLQANAYSNQLDVLNNQSLTLYLEALNDAKELNDTDLLVYVHTQIGFFYYTYNEYVKAMPFFIYTSTVLDQEKTPILIQPTDVYKKNAYFFDSLGEHEKSIEYLKKALVNTSLDKEEYAAILNNIGSCYYKLNNSLKAEEYFIKAKQVAKKNKSEVRYAKTLGDLALISFDKKEYQKTIDLLLEDIEISQRNKADRNTMYARIFLAKVYVATNQIDQAKQTLNLASNYITQKEYLQSYGYEVAKVNLTIALKTKDTGLELISRRIIDSLGEDIANKDGQEAINLINWETQKNEFNNKLRAGEEKLFKAQLMNWVSLGVLILFVVVLFLVILYTKRRFKIELSKKENNLLNYKIEQLESQNKLSDSRLTLKSYESYLNNQNKHIQLLESELKKLSKSKKDNQELVQNINSLIEDKKISNVHWLKIKSAFINEENEYYTYLLTQYPNLCETTLRIVILNKMKLLPAEIAMFLNIKKDVVEETLQSMYIKYKGKFDTHELN